MIKAVIFDMDGLMIDSERVTFECYQEILKSMNLTMDETFYKTLLGKPIKGIYERFYDTYGQDFPIESVIKDVHALMAKRFETEGVPVKKGLLVLLNYLKENGYNPLAFRFMCLQSHYRKQLVFSYPVLEQIQNQYNKLINKKYLIK